VRQNFRWKQFSLFLPILIIDFHKKFRLVNLQQVPCLDVPKKLRFFYSSQLLTWSNFGKELINQVQEIKVLHRFPNYTLMFDDIFADFLSLGYS
jgi:hypothetical protein